MVAKAQKPEFETLITTPVFRLSYPNVWRPRFNQLAKREQYDIQMLFDKKTAQTDLAAMIKLMNDLIVWKWKTKPEGFMNPFKNGDLKADKNPAFAGQVILSSWSKNAPGLVDKTARNLITEEDEIYGGCYCRAKLNGYAYEQGINKGVSFGLLHVQKIRDGEAFGNRTKPEDAFEAVEGAASASQAEDTSALFS